MRIILVGFGVVGKSITTILARRYAEKVRNYGFNPKIVAIADLDGAVISPRGLSSEKLESIKQRGYPISSDADWEIFSYNTETRLFLDQGSKSFPHYPVVVC